MGMSLPLISEGFDDAEDYSWLGSAHGTDLGDSCTLKASTFSSLFPSLIIPSGVVLAKVGGTGSDKNLFKLRTSGTAESVVTTRTSVGGTVSVAYEGRVGTTTVAASAAAYTVAALQAGLDSIPDLDAGYLVASGTTGGPITITGPTGVDLGVLTVDNTNVSGGGTVVFAAPTQGTEGGKAEGHLLGMTDLSNGNATAAYVWHGEVVVANLPANSGWDQSVPADIPTIRYQV